MSAAGRPAAKPFHPAATPGVVKPAAIMVGPGELIGDGTSVGVAVEGCVTTGGTSTAVLEGEGVGASAPGL
jgi:hypothetical protein